MSSSLPIYHKNGHTTAYFSDQAIYEQILSVNPSKKLTGLHSLRSLIFPIMEIFDIKPSCNRGYSFLPSGL